MGAFFKPQRRKVGCVLLLMALGLVGMRNLNHSPAFSSLEVLNVFRHVSIAWAVPEEKAKYQMGFNSEGIFFGKFRTDVVGMTGIFVFAISYWSLIVPPSILSAYLLLWPGKQPERQTQSPAESAPSTDSG